MLKGLTWQTLKSNYSLVPLFSVVALGLVMAAGHSIRSLVYSSDVKCNRRSQDRPWETQVNDDGSFNHAKYLKLNDYTKMKKSEYEPELKD
ncbi:unnamed protein product [Rotaria magnacalcarata]|uniref:Uncharacterized protein n=3 Tax=Rotaria magnacalcarata TaxID=392030 RepID=A0A819L2R3_9BILA|nr:unnamed protein product [Rotaria magnacalcarata]CAF3955818.1 unnamed protein product [Rotaria magnacalcarata]CAF4858046.1 unnamed protein product [Rotaria magnacalcarata]